jgi:4-hydroxy-3-polyprenylbenzoate decarboxylase
MPNARPSADQLAERDGVRDAAVGKVFVLGMAGGSGAIYGRRLLEVLLLAGAEVHLVVSPAGLKVLRYEEGVVVGDPSELAAHLPDEARARLRAWPFDAVESTPASGSAKIDAMVLCPCSMGTLARITHGFSTNLLERAGDVALKEGRRLVVVPRETPLSVVHLRNMLLLAQAGAIVLPAAPGFYHRPTRIEQLVDFVVARILDKLEVPHRLTERWKTPDGGPTPGHAAEPDDTPTSPWSEGEE